MIVRELNNKDVFKVAAEMRDVDFDEIGSSMGTDDRRRVGTLMMLGLDNERCGGWVFCTDDGDAVMIVAWSKFPENLKKARVGMFATDRFNEINRQVTRFVVKNFGRLINQNDVVQLEAQSIVTHRNAHRWLEFLGFHQHDLLENWGHGDRDFIHFLWNRPRQTGNVRWRRAGLLC